MISFVGLFLDFFNYFNVKKSHETTQASEIGEVDIYSMIKTMTPDPEP